MMLAVTVLCVLAAIGQYTLRLLIGTEPRYDVSHQVNEAVILTFLSTSVSLAIIPFVGMVLAVSGRRWYCLASFVAVMAAEAIILASVAYLRRPGIRTDLEWGLTFLLMGSYCSALFSLLVVRACGFRLVREPVKKQAIDEPTGSAVMIVPAN